MRRTNSPWIVLDKQRHQARLRLFCFPYAGGGSSIYRNWSDQLPKSVEVCCIELPGRGTRVSESPFSQLMPLVYALARVFAAQPTGTYAFFGHSMGALLSFEIARVLRTQHGIEPLCLFVSGCPAPQVFELKPQIHELPDDEFLNELRRLNGSPADVLAHEELMHLLLPTLRADFAICETYNYEEAPPLDCPIHAFSGLQDDEVTEDNVRAWIHQTNASFSLDRVAGDHFFVNSAKSLLLDMLSSHLGALLNKNGANYVF